MPEYPPPVQTVTTDIIVTADEVFDYFWSPDGGTAYGMYVRTSIVPGGEITISVHAVGPDESRVVASRVVASFATPPEEPVKTVPDALDDARQYEPDGIVHPPVRTPVEWLKPSNEPGREE